jgi:hypothetical protein
MMQTNVTCHNCTGLYHFTRQHCPHCDTVGEYPNVYLATQDQEALQQHHQEATTQANSRGVASVGCAFQHAVDTHTQACINRDYLEVERLMQAHSSYASFYQQLEAGTRQLTGDPWENPRIMMDTLLFPEFKERILFAALTLDMRGVSYYGSCSLILNEGMICARASLFRENSALYYIKQISLPSDTPILNGWRAVWQDRGRLAFAKLEPKLTPNTLSTDFASLLMAQDPAQAGDDDFLEVHIYGTLTIKTVREVVLCPQPKEKGKADRLGRLLKGKQVAYRQLPC